MADNLHQVNGVSGRRIRVSLVDDDSYLCKAVSRLLAASGIQSTTYTSAEEFLDDQGYLESDCLVLDVRLGGISGLDLYRHLVNTGSTVPVIFITAHDEPAIRDEAARLGCAAYLRKSDPGQAVIEAIRRASLLPAPGAGAPTTEVCA